VTEPARLPLTDVLVGVSISNSPDLMSRGLHDLHLRHAFVETVRHILAAGGSIAYGGDLRERGFTEELIDLIRTYDLPGTPGPQRIRSYLAWPTYDRLQPIQRAELKAVATPIPIDPPDGGVDVDLDAFNAKESIADRAIFARSLTRMRERLAQEISAAVLLGGGVTGFLGCYPGLAEEAALALRHGRAVYLIGGFGGCAQRIVEAVTGGDPLEFSLEHQITQTQGYGDLLSRLPELVDYSGIVHTFQKTGIRGLRNGLSIEENEVLFSTDDVDQIVALVLKGLRTLVRSS
jgi:hypothetical protein